MLVPIMPRWRLDLKKILEEFWCTEVGRVEHRSGQALAKGERAKKGFHSLFFISMRKSAI